MPLKLQRRERAEEDFQIAPMIDMVFLLLVFFMCVSSLAQADRSQDVELAESLEGEESYSHADRGIITIDATGQTYFGQRPVTVDEVEAAIQGALANNPNLNIVLRADRTTAYEHIQSVLEACARAGAYQVVYATNES